MQLPIPFARRTHWKKVVTYYKDQVRCAKIKDSEGLGVKSHIVSPQIRELQISLMVLAGDMVDKC